MNVQPTTILSFSYSLALSLSLDNSTVLQSLQSSSPRKERGKVLYSKRSPELSKKWVITDVWLNFAQQALMKVVCYGISFCAQLCSWSLW